MAFIPAHLCHAARSFAASVLPLPYKEHPPGQKTLWMFHVFFCCYGKVRHPHFDEMADRYSSLLMIVVWIGI